MLCDTTVPCGTAYGPSDSAVATMFQVLTTFSTCKQSSGIEAQTAFSSARHFHLLALNVQQFHSTYILLVLFIICILGEKEKGNTVTLAVFFGKYVSLVLLG